jgi:hypothetical protein
MWLPVATFIWLRRKVVKRAKAPLVYTIPLEKLKSAILDSRLELPALLAKMREVYLVMLEFFDHQVMLEPDQLHPAELASLRDINRELQARRQPNAEDVERWSASIEQLKPKVSSCVRLEANQLISRVRFDGCVIATQLFGVSKKTLRLVVQAMANEGGSNHWFKCPNVRTHLLDALVITISSPHLVFVVSSLVRVISISLASAVVPCRLACAPTATPLLAANSTGTLADSRVSP